MASEPTDDCICAICSLKIDFDFDTHLIREIERHNCVIFAGAGISTETKYTHPATFYQQLKKEARCEENLSFPQMVDCFQARPNGRQELIQLIIDRFSYIDGFRELKRTATRFHSELATMPYFSTVITTNWDRYFEEEIGATPFVYESDIPFWENARRSVLKIHGSIDNYTSIVASSEDYEACENRLRDGAIGAVLKQIFATKTCIFFGYSATDDDFLNIYNTVRHGLGALARSHYIVSPFLTDEDCSRLKDLNLIPIKTDATYFLSIVKQHMIDKFCFAPDEAYSRVAEVIFDVYDEHFEFTSSFMAKNSPHLMFSAIYQDGLIHALQRILDLRTTGQYSDLHYVRGQINLYEKMISDYSRKRDYWELSYFSGYLVGLEYFELVAVLADEEIPDVPQYFHPGSGPIDKLDYESRIRHNPEVHKAALAHAKGILRRRPGMEVVQHLPWG